MGGNIDETRSDSARWAGNAGPAVAFRVVLETRRGQSGEAPPSLQSCAVFEFYVRSITKTRNRRSGTRLATRRPRSLLVFSVFFASTAPTIRRSFLPTLRAARFACLRRRIDVDCSLTAPVPICSTHLALGVAIHCCAEIPTRKILPPNDSRHSVDEWDVEWPECEAERPDGFTIGF
ncbi:hypothetical protein BJ138DRAFT_1163582 [Hygrophoropsis aurantiaca]|uniref:Uncharacterized protein n=1 Tax=Hygrophoropsis aurantiaca TaxID=72124 RepID=A0ACB7ZXQ9_9AGAM|nr:hypothetical protein BJ138DRAFT_1163582 [Hygrophoropsis aurantiaca]